MFPNPLLLATEIGYSLIPGVHAAPVKSWAEFRNIIRDLKKPEAQEKYKTIVIDTVGLLTDMCMTYVCNKAGVEKLSDIAWGQGWTEFKKEFRTQLNTVAQLGYGIVLIAHSDTKKDNETGVITSALPTMDKKPRESVIALVDFIFYLQKEPADYNSDLVTVYAYSQLASAIETKTRARYLKPRFEFTFENLETEVAAAVEKLGVNVITDTVVNAYAIQALPFDTLKENTLSLAQELIGHEDSKVQEATKTQIATIMRGVRVSEATSTHYDQIATLHESLVEIKDSL
jgi:hypothetical protein